MDSKEGMEHPRAEDMGHPLEPPREVDTEVTVVLEEVVSHHHRRKDPLLDLILSVYLCQLLQALIPDTSTRLWNWFSSVDTDRSGAITANELGS